MTDLPVLIERARRDPAMIRDFGRPGRWDRQALSDGSLAIALGYTGPSGRNTIARLAAGGRPSGDQTRLLLMALLDGWRPQGE